MLADAPVALVRPDPAPGEGGDALRARLEELRGRLHAWQEIRIAHQIRDPKLREAGLARTEQLPRPAQLEIAPRDLEAVVGGTDDLEARARRLGERCPIEEETGAGLGAAADAAAQLVQLRQPHALGVLD